MVFNTAIEWLLCVQTFIPNDVLVGVVFIEPPLHYSANVKQRSEELKNGCDRSSLSPNGRTPALHCETAPDECRSADPELTIIKK